MAQFNSKNQASRVARRWFTDIDINMTNHPQTGDLSLKYDINGFIQGQDDQGRPVQGQVVKIDEESINLNMNHPLAGEDLNFEIELLEIVD